MPNIEITPAESAEAIAKDLIAECHAHLDVNEWNLLTDSQRRALVDHELCHCGVKDPGADEPEWTLRAHDIEEFKAVIERHGFWKSDVREFSEAAHQLKLRMQ